MKKILKAALTAAIGCIMAAAFSVCVYAETEDVELSVQFAVPSTGSWGQSITYYRVPVDNEHDVFDCGRITPDTIVTVEYELDGTWVKEDPPVELILQNYSSSDPQIWAQVLPFEWDETSASFDYQAMVKVYGSEDLSTVDNLWLGDRGIVVTATKFTLTNCAVEEVTTTTEAETTTKEETTAAAETEAAKADDGDAAEAGDETAVTSAAQTESENTSNNNVLYIVIGVVAVVIIIAVVVVIIAKKPKNKFY
ncbi:MAG: hypothetical protein J1F11_08580 [Oscillospiraceae bacterium]|nr:hypothetical protein [Oscillospiraceae bacterium]